MVEPSPFDRMLQHAVEQAQHNPHAAFNALKALYGKTTEAEDVLKICAYITNIGASLLDRIDDTLDMLAEMADHPALSEGDDTWRSIKRAQCVLHTVTDNPKEADACRALGVTDASEQCRVAVMTAQTFTARKQTGQAIPFLKQSAALCQELASSDPVVAQVSQVSMNISQLAAQQLHKSKELFLASATAVRHSLGNGDTWQQQHLGLCHLAKAHIACGQPSEALALVQSMMKLEATNNTGPLQAFHSASFACQAQRIRGQKKVAEQAYKACANLLKRIQEHDDISDAEKAFVTKIYEDLSN